MHKMDELHASSYEKPQILIFAATRHHVEFIHLVKLSLLIILFLLQ